jgi:two-component system sensor histidine kinase HydH
MDTASGKKSNWRAVTSAGHYLTPRDMRLWHGIFQRLYYLPVVYAAIAFGWVGGLAAAALAAVLYIPHILIMWQQHEHHYALEQYAEIFMFLAVGIVTGVLSDRERKRRSELQVTAQKLSHVYRELQDTFEQVKRADRLSAIGQRPAWRTKSGTRLPASTAPPRCWMSPTIDPSCGRKR